MMGVDVLKVTVQDECGKEDETSVSVHGDRGLVFLAALVLDGHLEDIHAHHQG